MFDKKGERTHWRKMIDDVRWSVEIKKMRMVVIHSNDDDNDNDG